jgi:hypothetical protein
MSNGFGMLALRAYEENSPRPGGRCRRAGRIAVHLPAGGRNRLADHDRNHALQRLAAVRGNSTVESNAIDLVQTEPIRAFGNLRRGAS